MKLLKSLKRYARRYPRSKLFEALRQAPSAGGATAVQQHQGTKGSRRLSPQEIVNVYTVIRSAFRLAGLNRFRDTRRKVIRLLESAAFHPAVYLPQIKSAAHECRRYYIEGGQLDRCRLGVFASGVAYGYLQGNPDACMQLSYIGRALPVAQPSERAFTKYIEVLTSPSPRVPDFLRKRIERYALLFEKRKRNVSVSYGGVSACTQYSRKQGGSARATYELLELRAKSFGSASAYEMFSFPPPSGRKPLYKELTYFGAAGLGLDPKWVGTKYREGALQIQELDIPSGKAPGGAVQPVPIPELGYKLRWVTKSPAQLTYLGQTYRSEYFPVLQDFRQTGEPLRGEDSEFFMGYRKHLVFSSDLTAATDRVSSDALQIICRIWNIPLTQLTGHQIWWKGVSYNQTRGSLMGLPVSWVSLSLIHLAVADYVCYRCNMHRLSFRIKGDDLLAVWNRKAIKLYKRLMADLGFQVNDRKSFVSESRGLFCEKAYVLNTSPSGGVVLTREDKKGFQSLRWTIDRSTSTDMRSGLSSPWYLTIGDHLHDIRDRPNQAWLTDFLVGDLITESIQKGIDPYIPVQLGGLGIPASNPLRTVRPKDAVLITAFHNSRGGSIMIPPSLLAHDEHSREVANSVGKVIDDLRYYAEGSTIRALGDDSVIAKVHAYYSQSAFLKGKLPTVRSPKVSAYLYRLRRNQDRLRKKFRGVKPLEWSYHSANLLFRRMKPSLQSLAEAFSKRETLTKNIGFKVPTPEEYLLIEGFPDTGVALDMPPDSEVLVPMGPVDRP